jgi:hypothetical protein
VACPEGATAAGIPMGLLMEDPDAMYAAAMALTDRTAA